MHIMGYNTACSTIALVKPNRVKLLKHDPGMQDYENCLVIDALYGIMFSNFSDCPVFFGIELHMFRWFRK